MRGRESSADATTLAAGAETVESGDAALGELAWFGGLLLGMARSDSSGYEERVEGGAESRLLGQVIEPLLTSRPPAVRRTSNAGGN